MNTRFTLLCCLAIGLTAQPAVAQDPPPDSASILQTILLPTAAEALRELGVPTEEIESVVAGARERRVPPSETAVILQDAAQTVDEHGPIDNFGAFVQEQLQSGLRGRELAEAIRAEHARRGIGKGRKLESHARGPDDRGPAAGAGRPGGERGPAAAGNRGGPPRPDEVQDTTTRPRGRAQRRDTIPGGAS